MNQKSENNKYDIVTEAEAVLAAYAQRCKGYAKRSEKRSRRGIKGVFWLLAGIVVLGALWYIGFCL